MDRSLELGWFANDHTHTYELVHYYLSTFRCIHLVIVVEGMAWLSVLD